MSSFARNWYDVQVMWKPSNKSGKLLKKLIAIIEEKYNRKFNDYWDFHNWTIQFYDEFWEELWNFLGIIYSKNYQKVIDRSIPISECPKWFEGAELNYAENLLKFRDDKIALIVAAEDKETEMISYAQLYEESKLYAAAFKKFGVRKGDVVMCYMSNRKEAIFGMLATVSIGAVWTGTLPQLGYEAVLKRVSQVMPKLLLTLDRFSFDKEEIDMLPKVEEIAKGLPSLEKVVVISSEKGPKRKDISKIRNSCFLDEFLSLGYESDGSVRKMEFEQVSLSYPVCINFTSGTTGLPKALVHGSGILLMLSRDYYIHLDTARGDVLLSMSPVGWASWFIFCTMLFNGVTIVLYEGQPWFLSPTYLWDMVDDLKITHALLTASVLDEIEKRGYVPTKKHSLSSLKVILSGGSVIKLKTYDFIYNELKLDVMFAPVYGCTEVMGLGILDSTLPVHKGYINPTLGTLLECYDETSGKPILGEIGDLVLSIPTPGMCLGLMGDEDNSAFKSKYFSKYPGKFYIGDSALINHVTKRLIVYGRSDDTLKQRGCRIGCSDIYNIVEQFNEVHDSLCASQYNREMDERAVLFLKMKSGYDFNEDLVKKIRQKIAADLTPRHVPDVILETKEIPFNENGKKMELLVKKVINNFPYNTDSLRNPGCLKYYKNCPELQKEF